MKHKKLLLSALLSVFVFSGAFAQFNISTNTTIGQVLKNSVILDKDTFIVNFNTISAPSAWFKAKGTANLGKDSLIWKKVQTQKGLQVKAFLDATTTTEYKFGQTDCNNYGSNRNPMCVYSIDSLKSMMTRSIVSGTLATINGNVADTVCRPAACLFNVGTGDASFGLYPGRAKRIEYGFYISMVGKQVTDDITFDMNTIDPGNSGKTATYGLRVYKNATFTAANAIGDSVATIYTTGSGKVTINLAQAIKVSPSVFTNQLIYIIIKTLGTSNASGIKDGKANDIDANHIPVFTDPTIAFDNLTYTYSAPYFTVPLTSNTNSNYVNYNNGAPAVKVADAALANPGTAIPVTTGVNTPVTFNLKSFSRVGTFTIIENLSHSTVMTVDAATAFKGKDINGVYNVPISATRSDNSSTLLWTLTLPAPTSGIINDDMTFTFNVNRPTDGNSTFRLETSNGTARFYYDFLITATSPSGINGVEINKITVTTSNSKVFVANATENVIITNIAGQRVKTVSASEAASGIQLASGIYLVKTGSTVQKVVVK